MKAGVDLGLTVDEQATLKRLARDSIASALDGDEPPAAPTDGALGEKRGAFVTLKIGGALRGCIGTLTPAYPLSEAVIRMARAAAFDDPRFAPLSRREFGSVGIEISALTPFVKVNEPCEIVIGRDGLLIRHRGSSGLLLPQVATEEGWDVGTFLRHTCLKAGLHPEAWKEPGAVIERFSAQVF